MKYIGKYTDSSEVQTALNEEVLGKPYVALVDGVLDYNSLDAEEPIEYMGEWSDDGEGTYTFQILDTDPDFWSSSIQIGTLLDVYYAGTMYDIDIFLHTDGEGIWSVEFRDPSEIMSEAPFYEFHDESSDEWDCGFSTDENSSDASVHVSWDGEGTFSFFSGDSEYPVSINTIDPENVGE